MKTSIINNQGTPKNLQEAIKQSLCCGPLSEIEERIYLILKDYLAQRFGAMMLVVDEPTQEVLKLLFEKITERQ